MITTPNGHTLTVPNIARNQEIEAARQEKLLGEAKIMQKVNHAHREAFRVKYPGQVEHCMRLTAERLQGLLTKKPSDLADTDTWAGQANEIKDLCEGLYYLSLINQQYPIEGE